MLLTRLNKLCNTATRGITLQAGHPNKESRCRTFAFFAAGADMMGGVGKKY